MDRTLVSNEQTTTFSAREVLRREMLLQQEDHRRRQQGGDEVVCVRLEEETRPDGTIVRRSVISQKPRVSKIWVKNSTDKTFLFRASCDRSVAFSAGDASGFSTVSPESNWGYSYVQQLDPAQSLCYIKVISEDGRQFWDITSNLDPPAPDRAEDAFEIFRRQGQDGGGLAVRPLSFSHLATRTLKKAKKEKEETGDTHARRVTRPPQRRRTTSMVVTKTPL